MDETGLAVKEQGNLTSDVSPERWGMMVSQAEAIVKSKLCPSSDTKESVVIKLLAGREFGLSAMQSLRSLYVVSGKIAMMSDIAAGLVLQRLPGAQIDCVETTDKIATFEASRPGGKVTRLSFTWAEAVKAGLTGGTGWQKYPAQMLRARCQIAICRLVFPDICAGLYTPDELGDKKAGLGERVPFETQMAAEKERIGKKESGIIDAKSEPVNDTIPAEPEIPTSVPPEAPEQPVEVHPKTPQDKCGLILQYAAEIAGQDKAPDKILEWSSFIGKDGTNVAGKSNPFDLSTGRITVVYGKAKTEYYAWKKEQQ